MFHPHFEALAKWDDEHSIGNSELHQLNIPIALYLRSCRRYGEAETACRHTLATTEKMLGPGHTETLTIAQNLAVICW